MHVLSTILPALGFASLASAKYSLHEDYGTNGSFFDKFNFFTVGLTLSRAGIIC